MDDEDEDDDEEEVDVVVVVVDVVDVGEGGPDIAFGFPRGLGASMDTRRCCFRSSKNR